MRRWGRRLSKQLYYVVMGPCSRRDDSSLRRNSFGKIFVEFVLDRREGRERLGRERDRLAVAVGGGRCAACDGFAGQRVKRGADASTEMDQFALAAACRDRERQRIKMASAITEQRQHRPDLGRDAGDQLRQAMFAGAVHFAEQLIPNRAEVVLKGVAA